MSTVEGEVRASGDGWGRGLYSHDGRHRFWFLTEVDSALRGLASSTEGVDPLLPIDSQTLAWVGLNPSRSDDNGDKRATLQTVLLWAQRAGLRRVLGVNLYAYRETDSRAIRSALGSGRLDAVMGLGNDQVLAGVAEKAEHVLLAWGSLGVIGGRGSAVAALFPKSR